MSLHVPRCSYPGQAQRDARRNGPGGHPHIGPVLRPPLLTDPEALWPQPPSR